MSKAPDTDTPAKPDTSDKPSDATDDAITPEQQRRLRKELDRAILLAAEDWRFAKDGPVIPPPIHSAVTVADMQDVERLLNIIIVALREGQRQHLDLLAAGTKGVLLALDLVPRPYSNEAEPEKFFLCTFGHMVADLHHLDPNDPNRPARIRHWSRNFPEYDPAFTNLSDTYIDECCRAITWGTGKHAHGWIRAAAKIAVRAGAFGSMDAATDEERRIHKLDNRLGRLWSARDKKRFREPPLPKKTVTRR